MLHTEFEEIIRNYRSAKQKLIVADYDGTLVGFEPRPELARPSSELLELISKLTKDQSLTFAVVSGRNHETLGEWFDGYKVFLAAEHGYMSKVAGGDWRANANVDITWKKEVRAVMDSYVQSVKDTFVEEKLASLCWHFRLSNDINDHIQDQLLEDLMPIVRHHDLSLLSGKKLVEVRQNLINKGHIAEQLLEADPDFTLIVGDDQTDEDMLAIDRPGVYTIKIGEGESKAKYRFSSYTELIKLLEKLI